MVLSVQLPRRFLVNTLLSSLTIIRRNSLVARLTKKRPITSVGYDLVTHSLIRLYMSLHFDRQIRNNNELVRRSREYVLMRNPNGNSLLNLTTQSNRTVLIRVFVGTNIRPLKRPNRPIKGTHFLRTINNANSVVVLNHNGVLTRQRNRRLRVLRRRQRSVRMLVMTMLASISTIRRSSALNKIM